MKNKLHLPQYIVPPKYLTSSSSEQNQVSNNFNELIDRDIIKNIAKSICNELHHPVTIVDIKRLFNESDIDNSRIDSDIEYFSLRPICRLFRHCAGREKCIQCDAFHTKYLANLIKNGEITSNALSFFYEGYSEHPPKILKNFPRYVLEYQCPILGYREMLFPFFYRNEIIGVLFVGQSIVEDENDREQIKAITTSFFNKNPPKTVFKQFLEKNHLPASESKKIQKAILEENMHRHEKYNYTNKKGVDGDIPRYGEMTFQTLSEYEDFIIKICQKVDDIEKLIEKHAREKREDHFEKIVQDSLYQFFQRPKHDNSKKISSLKKCSVELEEAWIYFSKAADIIKEQLYLKNVLLFGDGIYGEIIENKKKRLFPLPDKASPFNETKYDFSVVEGMQPPKYDFLCSLDNADILNGLETNEETIDKENVIMLVYPDVAVLLEVTDRNLYEDIYNEMAQVIGRNFSRIRSVVSLCAANLMQERHILTLRMNRHESLNISTKLSGNMNRYLRQNGLPFVDLEPEKRNNIVNDLNSAVRLISNIAQNIGIITGSVNENSIKRKMKEKVDVPDLLVKWQVMFRDTLEQRNLDIEVWVNNSLPRVIFTNRELFELLVYNLVDNAVKYAYRGSVIKLEWCTDNYESCLKVISYGPRIDPADNPYELYSRGKNAIAGLHAVQGDGIGLYVVKRIEQLLGLLVHLDSDHKVSSYNLPLISWFIDEDFTHEEDWVKDIQDELKKYVVKNHRPEWQTIINKHEQSKIRRENKDITKEYLKQNIKRETWETIFTVYIPKL